MIKSIKNKFIFLVTLSLCLMLGVTGYFAFKPKEKINAASQNISVLFGNFDKDNTDNFGIDQNTNVNTSKVVNDDTFVLLPTDNSKAIKIHFALSNSEDKIISLSSSLTINGISMDTQQQMVAGQELTDFTQYIYYSQSLKENPTDASSNVYYTGLELQGEYIYTFEYVSSLTDTKQVETVRFYVGFESDYLNDTTKGNSTQTQPILYNTEKIYRYKDSAKNNVYGDKNSTDYIDPTNKEFNYFHFSNDNITDYNGAQAKGTTQNNLLFPKYTYDASRYNLSWTCALNGITTYYTTEFISYTDDNNNDNGYLNIYKSLSSSDRGTLTNEYGSIKANVSSINTNASLNNVNKYKTNHYIVNIEFDQVGEYQFSLQPVVSTSEHNYKVVSSQDEIYSSESTDYNPISNNYYLLGAVELRIFGYELFYTNYNGGNEDVLQFITRDNDNNLITADVTNKVKAEYATDSNDKDNIDYTNITNLTYNSNSLSSSLKFEYAKGLFNDKIVTNQAPIMFSKYAAQMSMKNSITSKSTCLYYPTSSSEATETDITNSTKFSSNGYYIVIVKYTYMHYYQYDIDNGIKQSKTGNEFVQVFAFQIKNTEPSVKITSNNETIYSNEITNSNIQFSYETNNNLFDVMPSIKVFSLTNTQTGDYQDVTNNSGYVESLDNKITLKGSNNMYIKYKVELQYGPNKNTSVIYSFTIDKTDVNSSVYLVNKDNDTNSTTYNKYLVGDKVNEQNNFAVTNQNFYLNINNNKGTKNSGAIISATYKYFSLQQRAVNDKKYTSTNTDNFKFIENGYYIDLSTSSTYNYGVASFEDNSKVFTGNNASYVLTNPGLYIFTIKDSAGNTYTKTVLYENTAPIILIDKDLKDNKDNPDNITNKEEYSVLTLNRPIYLQSVNVAYGRYKAIEITNSNEITLPESTYLTKTNIAGNNDTTKTYFIFVNTPSLTLSAGLSDSYLPLTNETDKFVYGYNFKLDKPEDGGTYTLTVTSNGIKSNTKEITMSTDNSQFMAHPLDKTDDSLLTENRIDEFNYTNKSILKFSWINDLGGDYEIESINLKYYPLTYDKNSKYYPYSEEYTSTTDLLSFSTITSKDNIDGNLGTSCYASVDFSATGMYVIERTYHNEISNIENSLDQKTRRYIYFIDRNDIFKTIQLNEKDSITLGSLISMTVGNEIENDNNYKIYLTANDFMLKGNNNSLFSSNKLPISLILDNVTLDSYYKYAQNDIADKTTSNDSIFDNVYTNNKPNTWLSAIKSAYKLDILVDGNKISSSDDILSLTKTGVHTIKFQNDKDSWTLNFTIDADAPTGYFIKSTSNGSYALLDETPINYTDGLKFAYNEPTSIYTARINKDAIKIRVNNQNIDFNASMITSDSYYDNIIDLGNLLSGYTTGDLLVEIDLEYYGNNNYDNYKSTKKIYIDRTCPNLNYNRAKQLDTYLSDEEKQGFDDYNSALSFDNYAFNIDKNFTLQLDKSNSEFITNTSRLYTRHYDKFNEDLSSTNFVNYQSIVNGDDRYLNDDVIRLKFDPALSGKNQTTDRNYMFIQATGTEGTVNFYDYLKDNNSSYLYGYFEIIEVDEAGNQSIFTVYLPNYEDNDVEKIVFVDEDENVIENEINLETLPSFSIKKQNDTEYLSRRFLKLEIVKNGRIISNYKIAPITLDGYITIDEAINIIKQTSLDVDEINGSHFEFNIYYDTISENDNIVRINSALVYNYPSEKINLTFTPSVNGNTRNLLVSWENNSSTYIKNIVVETANTDGSFTSHTTDSEGNVINNLQDENGNYVSRTFVFNVQSGEYFKFTITDNFNRTYSLDYISGLNETKEIVYSKNSVNVDGINYTAGQTYVNYQSKLYLVEIYDLLNGNSSTKLTEEEIANLGIEYRNNSSTGISTYSLFNLNAKSRLLIRFTNLDSTYTYSETIIEYVNALATVQLKLGSDVVFDLDKSISSDINSSLNALTLFIKNEDLPEICKTRVYASVVTSSGSIDLGELQNGTILSTYGKYTIVVSNNLGLSKTFIFELRDSKANDFTVSTITGRVLSPSPKKYIYANNSTEWFFSTEEYSIEYSGRFASMEQEFVTDNGNTIVYKLTTLNDTGDPSKTKTKYFTVTRVSATSNFINDLGFTINSNKITLSSNNLKYFDNEIVLKMEQPYFEYEGNIITVSYSFNGSNLVTIPFDSITQYNLSDAGVYTFYFTDVAGNTQVFNNTRYLNVSLFNKVVTLVNGQGQINNAIYNQSVTVSITNYEEYVYENRNTIKITATKDGLTYQVSGKNGIYTFNEYGVYNISISGIMQGRTLENQLKFTILNENEAFVAYEYIGNSGYEITSITRDGEDVYDEIVKAMSKQVFNDDLLLTSISKIVLSGSSLPNHIGGNGKYEITVTARKIYNNLDLDFTFKVWINSNNDVYILSSIDAGTSTTKAIEIRINTKQIYEKIGTCNVTINDKIWLQINSDGTVNSYMGQANGIELVQASSQGVNFDVYKLTKTGEYNIKIQTLSGNNTLMSFTVTKNEPLNSTAILVIVIVVIVLAAIITLFILLRKKMRVK